MADYLPPDVLTLIYQKLHAKTLLRCTSVCKSWHSFITHPNFIDAHLNRKEPDDLFLVRSHPKESEVYSLHYDDESFTKYANIDVPFGSAFNDYYRIIGSCKGVICLSDDLFSYTDMMILWNPTIRKWLRLPQPRISLKCGALDGVIGFGYDANSNDYKVVRVVYYDGIRCPAEVDVYSLSIGSWRNVSNSSLKREHFICPRSPQAYFSGAVHWIVSDISKKRNVIVLFNMSSELFHTLDLPDTMPYVFPLLFNTKLSLKVIEGSLSLVECDKRRCCIWLMKEYGVSSSWTKKVDIEVDRVVDRLIGYRKSGELLFEVKGDLCSYDPEAMKRRDRLIMEELRYEVKGLLGANYDEALDLINQYIPKATELKELRIFSRYGDYLCSLDKCALHIESYTESLVLLGMQTRVEENETESGKEDTEGGEEETESKNEVDNETESGEEDTEGGEEETESKDEVDSETVSKEEETEREGDERERKMKQASG